MGSILRPAKNYEQATKNISREAALESLDGERPYQSPCASSRLSQHFFLIAHLGPRPQALLLCRFAAEYNAALGPPADSHRHHHRQPQHVADRKAEHEAAHFIMEMQPSAHLVQTSLT